ncbi:hypothetical protein ENC19_27935 [Verrucosispora sp. CWR15]|uniref:Uncharacterized protein n=1 Tax=Verrucosispora sioxanthis TaxID=2499994 RepID=A0A6M1LDN3_9ACTN|nr:hypothetical protein [Verrucosispora sioxanthis]NEE67074.1 hypothetical protein [Verrucosispora sioxanthis]NGM16184.1 hypothetical protein [Verrucosispora sioxanthis]
MGEQAVTGADGAPAPERTPGPGGEDAAAATGSPGPATAGMTADGAPAGAVEVPGAGMTADAGGATGPRSRTADIVPGPGGVMTDEVGVVTGELTLRTDFADGRVSLHVQYKDADEWYAVTGGSAPLPDAAGLDAVHDIAVGLLHRPEG